MKLRISCDLDGCLADFESGYLERFGKWPNYDWVITRNVTYILSKEPEFWLNLPVLNTLDFVPVCYCSARINNISWTLEYLDINNFPKAPLYQIPGYKFSKYSALKDRCDVHIEDSLKNFIDLNLKGVPCLLYDRHNLYNNPMLTINSFDYNEIEDVFNLGKEFEIFKNFRLYEKDYKKS